MMSISRKCFILHLMFTHCTSELLKVTNGRAFRHLLRYTKQRHTYSQMTRQKKSFKMMLDDNADPNIYLIVRIINGSSSRSFLD